MILKITVLKNDMRWSRRVGQ